jgi:hypothetical protein
VVVDDVEISTFAGAVEVPALDVPLELMIRPTPFTVRLVPETVATLPDAEAREKPPPPNPPPPPPKPPLPLPPPAPPPLRPPKLPVAPDGQGVLFPLIAMERAVIGPAAEPLVGGVPVALMQLPPVTSCTVADTV